MSISRSFRSRFRGQTGANRAMSRPVERKLEGLRAGGKPRVLDLFAGCGGLSLGFRAAGFEIAAAVENDPDAAKSHGTNFHHGAADHSKARDICSPPESLVAELGLGDVERAFDVIVGGPPCQAFARVGRPKLREIDDHPTAFLHDPRARLYLEWLHFVDTCKPLAVLMENVPDALNHGGQNIAEETCEVLEDKGYVCGYTLLNAAYYGVPQMRERLFLIGYRREIANGVTFSEPTHWVDLPPGYEGSRAVALKLLRGTDALEEAFDYIPPPEAGEHLPPAVTAVEAIGDLPPIDARAQLRAGKLRRGCPAFRQAPGLGPPAQGLRLCADHADVARLRGARRTSGPRHPLPAAGLRAVRADEPGRPVSASLAARA